MMGKCVEKMKREPLEYLEHYRLVGMAHTVHDGKKCGEDEKGPAGIPRTL